MSSSPRRISCRKDFAGVDTYHETVAREAVLEELDVPDFVGQQRLEPPGAQRAFVHDDASDAARSVADAGADDLEERAVRVLDDRSAIDDGASGDRRSPVRSSIRALYALISRAVTGASVTSS